MRELQPAQRPICFPSRVTAASPAARSIGPPGRITDQIKLQMTMTIPIIIPPIVSI